MSLRIGVVKETVTHEQRVALVPTLTNHYAALGAEILFETNAGLAAHFADHAYHGIQVVTDPQQIWQTADIILKVHPPTPEEIRCCHQQGSVVLGLLAPHRNLAMMHALCQQNITSFALELLPRISRAQAMDVLSSQASVAGYKAVLQAANLSGRFFPMLTTAAGTIRPISVLIIGAGVAGLQAIATAKRLGAVVAAYDIRPATREQVESLGAQFVDVNMNAASVGGYARELTASEQEQQQQILAAQVAKAEIIICTAAIPGRTAPVIISQTMVAAMRAGAVIIDLAAESGGNCELTQAGETISYQGVTIVGPLNVASDLAVDASEMYARNVLNFVKLLVNKEQRLHFNWSDPILAESVLTHAGEIKHPTFRQPLEQPA